MSYSFTKIRRLREKKDYDGVFAKAERLATSEFIILHKKSTAITARLGLALSKKAIPKAVQRNRIKRLLRESFRISELPQIDIIVLAKRGVDKIENRKLFSDLSAVWKKIALYYAS